MRNAEIGNKDFELDVLEEAYTTEHWLVRIYKVNMAILIDNMVPCEFDNIVNWKFDFHLFHCILGQRSGQSWSLKDIKPSDVGGNSLLAHSTEHLPLWSADERQKNFYTFVLGEENCRDFCFGDFVNYFPFVINVSSEIRGLVRCPKESSRVLWVFTMVY